MHRRRAGLAVGLAAIMAVSCAGDAGGNRAATGGIVRFRFWGDTPYSGQEASAVVVLLEQMNDAQLDVAIFVGDIFGGPCENSAYTAAVDVFNSFRSPLVYTPGDNEWTDCRPTRRDPLERLAHIRRTMFASGPQLRRRSGHA